MSKEEDLEDQEEEMETKKIEITEEDYLE